MCTGGESETVSAAHTALLNQCIKKIKDTGSRLSADHKELHCMVSKVGKAIDKVHLLLTSRLSVLYHGNVCLTSTTFYLQLHCL